MASPVFARTMWGCAGNPLIVALGALMLVGCTEPQELPEHAYTTFGDHWKCDRGFKRVADRCEEFPMPEHAFLNHSGNRWQCDRGFERVAERCEEIPVPEHAFLAYSGNRWQCERGYKRVKDQCLGS